MRMIYAFKLSYALDTSSPRLREKIGAFLYFPTSFKKQCPRNELSHLVAHYLLCIRRFQQSRRPSTPRSTQRQRHVDPRLLAVLTCLFVEIYVLWSTRTIAPSRSSTEVIELTGLSAAPLTRCASIVSNPTQSTTPISTSLYNQSHHLRDSARCPNA